jgi:hypothetical protein
MLFRIPNREKPVWRGLLDISLNVAQTCSELPNSRAPFFGISFGREKRKRKGNSLHEKCRKLPQTR